MPLGSQNSGEEGDLDQDDGSIWWLRSEAHTSFICCPPVLSVTAILTQTSLLATNP